MTPRPKTARRTSAPPLKRLRKPSTPDDEAELSRFCRRDQLTPGTGMLAPIWYRAMTASVKTTLLRRSGTLKMLASRESIALTSVRARRCHRFIRALPEAGGRPWAYGRGTLSTLPPAAVIAASADLENA